MEQGDGKLAYGVFVQNGRLKGELKQALRTVIERYELPVLLTANQNIILTEIEPSWKADILNTLQAGGVRCAACFGCGPRTPGTACMRHQTPTPVCWICLWWPRPLHPPGTARRTRPETINAACFAWVTALPSQKNQFCAEAAHIMCPAPVSAVEDVWLEGLHPSTGTCCLPTGTWWTWT